ncbi:MAG: alpha/beta hydrolase family protein [Chthoniobacterales bacterium]
MRPLFVLVLSIVLCGGAAGADISFQDDTRHPLDMQETGTRAQDGVTLHEITYALADGTRNAATVVTSNAGSSFRPAVLFVHWYGPPAASSNRSQFLPDAIELAKAGAVSLLIDTPWSRPEYFQERKREDDFARSVEQVKDLRRALDVLVSQPNVDRQCVAYVGHDFGAMYGALAAAADLRVRFFVFIAGTQSFSDWFLYGPKPPEDVRQKFIEEMAPLDPIRYLPKIQGPVLLQFADHDEHVTKERAEALAAAAPEPKAVRVYHSDHEIRNDTARRDRLAWLKENLKLQ